MLAGSLEKQPRGSGHSKQTAIPFSSQGMWAGHSSSSSAPGMEKELGNQSWSQPHLPLPEPGWVRSLQPSPEAPEALTLHRNFSRGVEGIWVEGYAQPAARKATGAAG